MVLKKGDLNPKKHQSLKNVEVVLDYLKRIHTKTGQPVTSNDIWAAMSDQMQQKLHYPRSVSACLTHLEKKGAIHATNPGKNRSQPWRWLPGPATSEHIMIRQPRFRTRGQIIIPGGYSYTACCNYISRKTNPTYPKLIRRAA